MDESERGICEVVSWRVNVQTALRSRATTHESIAISHAISTLAAWRLGESVE